MIPDVEAVVLTGGASARMGMDKATLSLHGVPMAERITARLLEAGIPVTVLGRSRVAGCDFLADSEEFAGPMSALARFEPHRDFVFVASCDMPRFDERIVSLLRESMDESDAAVPFVQGFFQPLCALYRSRAFRTLASLNKDGVRSLMGWLERIRVEAVSEEHMSSRGIDPNSVLSVNTPDEWKRAVSEPSPG